MKLCSDRYGPSAWPIIAAVALIAAFWMTLVDIDLVWFSLIPPLAVSCGMEVLAAFYRLMRRDDRLASMLTAVAELLAFSAAAAPLSYAVARNGSALWDATLVSWDQAMCTDWMAYLAYINAHPKIGAVLSLAYQSLSAQIILIVLLLGFTDRFERLRRFVWAFVITATITILVSGAMPALGTYAYFDLQPNDFANINPVAPYLHIADLHALRQGTFHSLSLGDAQGIITFPSLHAGLSILFLCTLWNVALVRWPAVVLNLCMLAATPIDGGHYFSDVLSGVAIAIFSMKVSELVCRKKLSGAPMRRAPSLGGELFEPEQASAT